MVAASHTRLGRWAGTCSKSRISSSVARLPCVGGEAIETNWASELPSFYQWRRSLLVTEKKESKNWKPGKRLLEWHGFSSMYSQFYQTMIKSDTSLLGFVEGVIGITTEFGITMWHWGRRVDARMLQPRETETSKPSLLKMPVCFSLRLMPDRQAM